MRRAFTLVELLLAVVLVGVLTALSMMTFSAVTNGWQTSTDYMDKLQRTDFALNQVVGGLRSMYYPHDGKQDANYGFVLMNNGDGAEPDRSDVIEWSKIGSAIVGNKSSVADSVHRVQVMVLEEGNRDWKEEIQKTGLYARQCPDVALRPKDDEVDYSFANDEMYQPVLIADGIVGFNCRVMKTADDIEDGGDGGGKAKFEEEWESSNSVPYKVELTFFLADPEGRAYRSNTAPVMRIVKIPIFEQSQDGATTPADDDKAAKKGPGAGVGLGGGRGGRGGKGGAQGGRTGGAQGGRPGNLGGNGGRPGGVGGGRAPGGAMPPGGGRR